MVQLTNNQQAASSECTVPALRRCSVAQTTLRLSYTVYHIIAAHKAVSPLRYDATPTSLSGRRGHDASANTPTAILLSALTS